MSSPNSRGSSPARSSRASSPSRHRPTGSVQLFFAVTHHLQGSAYDGAMAVCTVEQEETTMSRAPSPTKTDVGVVEVKKEFMAVGSTEEASVLSAKDNDGNLLTGHSVQYVQCVELAYTMPNLHEADTPTRVSFRLASGTRDGSAVLGSATFQMHTILASPPGQPVTLTLAPGPAQVGNKLPLSVAIRAVVEWELQIQLQWLAAVGRKSTHLEVVKDFVLQQPTEGEGDGEGTAEQLRHDAELLVDAVDTVVVTPELLRDASNGITKNIAMVFVVAATMHVGYRPIELKATFLRGLADVIRQRSSYAVDDGVWGKLFDVLDAAAVEAADTLKEMLLPRLQRWFRVSLAKRQRRQRSRERVESRSNELYSSSAYVIQRTFRGRKQQEQGRRVLEAKREHKRQAPLVVRVESFARGLLSQRVAQRKTKVFGRVNVGNDTTVLSVTASTMQQALDRVSQETPYTRKDMKLRAAASVSMQRIARGHQARKDYTSKRVALATLQSCLRMRHSQSYRVAVAYTHLLRVVQAFARAAASNARVAERRTAQAYAHERNVVVVQRALQSVTSVRVVTQLQVIDEMRRARNIRHPASRRDASPLSTEIAEEAEAVARCDMLDLERGKFALLREMWILDAPYPPSTLREVSVVADFFVGRNPTPSPLLRRKENYMRHEGPRPASAGPGSNSRVDSSRDISRPSTAIRGPTSRSRKLNHIVMHKDVDLTYPATASKGFDAQPVPTIITEPSIAGLTPAQRSVLQHEPSQTELLIEMKRVLRNDTRRKPLEVLREAQKLVRHSMRVASAVEQSRVDERARAARSASSASLHRYSSRGGNDSVTVMRNHAEQTRKKMASRKRVWPYPFVVMPVVSSTGTPVAMQPANNPTVFLGTPGQSPRRASSCSAVSFPDASVIAEAEGNSGGRKP